MSEFSDRPFVAGSLVGLRAFDVDSFGRLVGPTFPEVFTPGQNEAKCYKTLRSSTAALKAMERSLAVAMGTPVSASNFLPTPTTGHRTGEHACRCGYYAYFDGSNTHASVKRVTAVIEGYGVCTVGTRGFRAERARLVALVLPSRPTGRLLFWAAIAVGNVWGIIRDLATDAWWDTGLSVLGLVGALTMLALLVLRTNWKRDDAAPFALVRRNYPDVPVYRTEKAALKAHPLTPPPSPTPDDEDFWTREAR